MANGQINLTISEKRTGNALSSVAKDVSNVNERFKVSAGTMRDMAKAAVTLNGALGSVVKNFIGGSFWTIGAQALKFFCRPHMRA